MPDVIFINRTECTRCWRCVRECPVKALDCGAQSAAIAPGRCTGCGHCLSVCRYGAVKLRDDVPAVRAMLKNHAVKVVSLSPQWVTEMDGIGEGKLIEALRLLGFTHVSEAALGAESTLAAEAARASGGVGTISARCPAVATYIRKYAPRRAGMLSGVVTPMEAHARMIRHWWGNDACVVHISACTAAKAEAESCESSVDAALTFAELKRWLREEGIEYSNLFAGGEPGLEPHPATKGLLYPLCGEAANWLGDTQTFHSSPLSSIHEALRHYRPEESAVWLDFMACRGGCTGSGVTCVKGPTVSGTLEIKKTAAARKCADGQYTLPPVQLETQYPEQALSGQFVAESQTTAALAELGMPTKALQSDCNACGFGTCRRFAKALSRGQVDKNMCWYYLGHGVKAKLDTLVAKLSSGVAIINSAMRIEQANRIFASIMGPMAESLFDSREGIAGRDADEILPFTPLIASVLESGEESLVRDVQIGEKLITVSIHTIQKHRLVLVICRNMLFSQVRNEEIVKRTQRVIDENLDTVRRIALLLGENASRTEAILNSILEANMREDG